MGQGSGHSLRKYRERYQKVNAFEIEELRATPVEVKLRQLWTLMSAADLFETPAEREAGVAEVRERWRRIRAGLRR